MTAKKRPAATTRRRPALYVTRARDSECYDVWTSRPIHLRRPSFWTTSREDGDVDFLMSLEAADFERLTGVSMPGGPTSSRKLTVKLTKVRP